MHSTAYRKAMSKLTVLLILVAWLFAPVHSLGQTISYSKKGISLEEVFEVIYAQTGYFFYYQTDLLKTAKRFDLSVKKASLDSVLTISFKNQPLVYELSNGVIHVREADTEKKLFNKKQNPVVGIVVNENGLPVPNVTITVGETNRITLTNSKGQFTLPDLELPAKLIFSSVGYQEKKVHVENNLPVRVTLTVAVNDLDESIVIGYGNTTRRLSTSSVGRVTAKTLEIQPVSNPVAALQGRIAGLFITQSNGLPGSNFNILIRGRNSIQQGTDPLFIVDGVPFDNQRLNQRTTLNANNPLNTINPLDIESIEVLKDADGTAIYGSRGANGVILITTKRIKANRLQLNASFSAGWGKTTSRQNLMSTQEYLTMRKEAFANDNRQPLLANAPDLLSWDSTAYTDWQQELIGGTARFTNTQLSIAAGTEQTKFNFSGNYVTDNTVFPGDFGNTRVSGQMQVTHQSNDKRFLLWLSGTASSDKSKLVRQDLTSQIAISPNMPSLFDESGNLIWEKDGISFTNPYSFLRQPYNATVERFAANFRARYQFTPQIEFTVTGGLNRVQMDEYGAFPRAAQNPDFANANAIFGNNKNSTWIVEPQLSYTRSFASNHQVNVLFGGTSQGSNMKRSLIDASGYPTDDLLGSTAGATLVNTQINGAHYSYIGFFGRISYSYAKKYLLNLSARRDGSSRFGPQQRFANFGSIGAGWVFTQETWMKKLEPIINFGKLRLSYGTTGNDQIGNYQFHSSWEATRFPYVNTSGLRPIRLFNPNYSWEQIEKLDAGVDLQLFASRIQLAVTRFTSRSNNQIINYTLPDQTGFSFVLQNFPGIVANSGWEFELSANPMQRTNFTWTTQLNLTIPRNKLVAFPDLESSSYASTYRVGYPLNLVQGFKYGGMDTQRGVYLFENSAGDLVHNPTQIQDYHLLGTLDPAFYGGISNSFHYKNWSIDVFFQIVKQSGRHFVFGQSTSPGNRNNRSRAVLDRWQPHQPSARYQQFTQLNSSEAFLAGYNISLSDANFVDASFARLKNLQLAYKLGAALAKRLQVSSFELFMQAQNLWTITSYQELDPETQSRSALPPIRMLTMGARISL